MQYLRHFRQELRAVLPGAEEEVLRRAEAQADQTYEARRGEAPDPQGLIISSCALILASYRELTGNGVSEDRAFEVVRRSFSSILAKPASRSVGAVLRFVPDPVRTMRRRSIAPFFRAIFGRLFTFEEERARDSFVFVIPRCGIHDFFRKEGEPQLTRAFCAWDRNWLGVLDSSDRPVATRRSLTLATGDHRCEFHFKPAEPGPAATVDVTL